MFVGGQVGKLMRGVPDPNAVAPLKKKPTLNLKELDKVSTPVKKVAPAAAPAPVRKSKTVACARSTTKEVQPAHKGASFSHLLLLRLRQRG